MMWTDARRPVPRLWIRSAEERGERRYENRNTTTTTVCDHKYLPYLIFSEMRELNEM